MIDDPINMELLEFEAAILEQREARKTRYERLRDLRKIYDLFVSVAGRLPYDKPEFEEFFGMTVKEALHLEPEQEPEHYGIDLSWIVYEPRR